MKINQICERWVSVWIYPQEAVEIPRSIHQEVLEAVLLAIGQSVAPDLLTDSHQECAFRFIHQQLLCFLAADNAWQEKAPWLCR